MASYWLDLVRFADTVGYHGDQDHSISPYRDWVIDAFNDDLPFDQFTREQLAGDLLPKATTDQIIATGYNRLLQTSHEGGVQPKEYIAMYAADRVRNLSEVWMGTTMGCAQCHEHKFDPFEMKDFYSLAAFFADIDDTTHLTKGSNSLPTRREPEISVLDRDQREQLAKLDKIIATKEALQKKTPDPAIAAEIKTLQSKRVVLQKTARKTMITRAIKPRVTRLLPRGNWLDETGPIVEPAVPEFHGQIKSGKRLTRLDLANWLTNPEQGIGTLNARVLVNRIWYLLFGRGLAPDLTDFGGQGTPPDHPKLLDNLSVSLIEKNWKLKALVREIVLSRTYRQASLPEDGFISFQSAYRLPAESVRDNALAISGLLVREIGGPSVKPYQPSGAWFAVGYTRSNTARFVQDHEDKLYRRSLYTFWKRTAAPPSLEVFNAPSRESCTVQRDRTNTPLQALTLMNDPQFIEAARHLATNAINACGNDHRARLNHITSRVLARTFDDEEHTLIEQSLQKFRTCFQKDPPAATDLVSIGETKADPAIPAPELATWIMIASQILNFDETITKN